MQKALLPDIATFIRVIELGSFASVAAESGFIPSGVSRIVTRLEDRLGTKLVHRSTRHLHLTPEGEAFCIHARRMLEIAEAAEADIQQTKGRPRGHLTVNSGSAFVRHKLAPVLPKFLNAYPDLTVGVSVSDRRIDPIAERFDVVIRVGRLADSDLIAFRLGTVRRIIAASRNYLEAHGEPQTPQELASHNCLLLEGFPGQALWPMRNGDRRYDIRVSGAVKSDNADTLLDMAVAGAGLIRLGDFLGADALANGKLVPVLTDYHFDDPQPISALILPGRQAIPRIRAFVDFIKSEF